MFLNKNERRLYEQKIVRISCFALIIPLLTGCSKGKWDLSKDEASKYIYLDGVITKKENSDNYIYSITESYPYFASNFTLEDVVCFNLTEILADENKTENDLYDVNYLKKHEVATSSLVLTKDNNYVQFEFAGNDKDLFGCLFAREASSNNQFIYSDISNPYEVTSAKIEQNKFETNYLNHKGPEWNEDQTKLDIYSYFDKVVSEESLIYKQQNRSNVRFAVSPTAVIKGVKIVVKIVGAIYKKYQEANTPNIVDVYKKLDNIDAHLTAISNQISASSEKASRMFVESIMQSEKNNIVAYDTQIQIFNDNYSIKIDNLLSRLNEFLSYGFKTISKSGISVSLFYKEVDGGYILSDKKEDESYKEYGVTISNFEYSKRYLAAHDDMPGNGFVDEFLKDIAAATVSADKPWGLTSSQFIDDVFNRIEYTIMTDFFSSESAESLANAILLKELFTNYANQLGNLIAETYIDRIRLMVNFASEAMPIIREMYSTLLYKLDRVCVLATMASEIAKLPNIDEIGTSYLNARNAIISRYVSESKNDGNYSYVMSKNVNGKVIEFVREADAHNTPDKTKFTGSIKVFNHYKDSKGVEVNKEISMNEVKASMLGSESLVRIMKRYQIMDASTNYPFITYLVKAGVFPIEQTDDIGRASNERYFVTSDFIMNPLSLENDRGLKMHRTSKYKNFFAKDNLGDDAEYGKGNEDHWRGYKLTGTIYNANTCSETRDALLAAYAQYYTPGGVGRIGCVHYGYVDTLSNHRYYGLFA